MPFASVAELLAALRSHRLLTPDQLDALSREALPTDARAVARVLVQRGWLTTYQINELFLGRGAHLLLGSYVLLESIGEGGMGQVFKARNWKLGHLRAVKLIRKERLANPTAIRRFHREIRMAAQLDHPNIVKAYDADEVNGTHFFVMEFVEGTDLHKVVKTNGPLKVARACEYVRQAALGLQHAFERGLVHRDIKPHNLLLAAVRGPSSASQGDSVRSHSLELLTSDSGLVKILDMGLARDDTDSDGGHSSTMTQEGTVMGTPDYMAPEQGMDSHSVDIRGDLYSLGCTLYYLLTGKPPFSGGSFTEKLMKHQLQPLPRLDTLRRDVPAPVVDIAHRLLAKRPEHRYDTPAELAVALEQALLGISTEEAPASVSGSNTAVAAPQQASLTSDTDQRVRQEWAAIAPAPQPVFPTTPARSSRWLRPTMSALALVLVASGIWWATRPGDDKKKEDELVITLPPRPKLLVDGGKEPEKKTNVDALHAPGPVTDAWIKAVRALPAAEQARAVFAKLKELNPGFDDNSKANIWEENNGKIIRVGMTGQPITDVSPLRALNDLEHLQIAGSGWGGIPGLNAFPTVIVSVADIAPLKGLPLKTLDLHSQRVEDLAPLAGMKLETLALNNTRVRNLTPLKGMTSLRTLWLLNTEVVDLGPLAGLKLTKLHLDGTPVRDLRPLAGAPLYALTLRGTDVSDLSPLSFEGLQLLDITSCPVEDLTPLAKAKTLADLRLQGVPFRSLEPLKALPKKFSLELLFVPKLTDALRGLPNLTTLNGEKVESFWKINGPDPEQERWSARVAGLPPAEQMEEVKKRLRVLNPDYKGEPKYKSAGDSIQGIELPEGKLSDLRFLTPLRKLQNLAMPGWNDGLASLEPLRGLPLRSFVAFSCSCLDISPLAGMPLEKAHFGVYPQFREFEPLRLSTLNYLYLGNPMSHPRVATLASLPLKALHLNGCNPRDLNLLRNLKQLEEIQLFYDDFRHRETLRAMTWLKKINGKAPDEFWKEIAEQQAEFVRREMVRLNSELAKFESKIDKGEVVELVVHFKVSNELGPIRTLRGLKKLHIQWGGPKVLSLEPLRGLPLREFRVFHTNVATFAPLQETQFDEIHIGYSAFKDLSLLKGVKVRNLKLSSCEIDDLTPLRGMSVESLDFHSVYGIKDLSPLEGLPLTHLSIVDSFRAKDLTPVGKIKPLRSLDFNSPHVRDLRFLEGLPLERLTVRSASLADLEPLKKLPNLKQFSFVLEPFRGDADVLRAIPNLETINGKNAKDFLKEADDKMAAFQKWCDDVAKLPPKKQVEKVAEELKKRNPEMTGTTSHRETGNQVTALTLTSIVGITDIAPIRALRHLKHLHFNDSTVAGSLTNLYPLKGMNLESLFCAKSGVADLEALRGMKSLRLLMVNSCPVTDLEALRGLELTDLHCGWTRVVDLTPLAGMKLNTLILTQSPIRDLSPLRGMPLRSLSIQNTQVSDLSPLKGMPLEFLGVMGRIDDYRIVLDLPELKDLNSAFVPWRDSAIIRSLKKLEKANNKPAKEYHAWADWEDAARTAPPKQQIEMLKTKLIELNGPNTDVSKVRVGPIAMGDNENSVLYCYGDFKDISPVRAIAGVHTLHLGQGLQSGKKSILADIAPLQGLKLKKLSLCGAAVTDLTPLRGMELEWFVLSTSTVVDLTPLKGMPLKELHARQTKIANLEPLRGMKLELLDLAYGSVSDLDPLRGMPLTDLNVSVNRGIKSIEPLAGMKLRRLLLYATAVTDLSVLKGMPLEEFRPSGGARDFSPLKGAPIRILDMSEHKGPHDWKALYGMPLVDYKGPVEAIATLDFLKSCQATLKTINGKPAAEVLNAANGK